MGDSVSLGTFGKSEHGGTIHSAGIAIDSLHKNRYEQYNEMYKRVFDGVLNQSFKYSNDVTKECENYHSRFSNINEKMIENKQLILMDNWNECSQMLDLTLNAQSQVIGNATAMEMGMMEMQIQSSNRYVDPNSTKFLNNPTNDPFLFGKSFGLKQKDYKSSLTACNNEMEKLLIELIRSDERCIDEL